MRMATTAVMPRKCSNCGAKDATHACDACKSFAFCSHACSDAMAVQHFAVCHDINQGDADLAAHLVEALVDMELDETGRYGIEDVEHGKELLAALTRGGDAKVEAAARATIAAHLDDAATAAVVRVGEDLRAVPHFASYRDFHRAELGAARIASHTRAPGEREESRKRIHDENARRHKNSNSSSKYNYHQHESRAPMSESAKSKHRERVRRRAEKHAASMTQQQQSVYPFKESVPFVN